MVSFQRSALSWPIQGRHSRQAGNGPVSVTLVQPDGTLVLVEDFEAEFLATDFGGKRVGGQPEFG